MVVSHLVKPPSFGSASATTIDVRLKPDIAVVHREQTEVKTLDGQHDTVTITQVKINGDVQYSSGEEQKKPIEIPLLGFLRKLLGVAQAKKPQQPSTTQAEVSTQPTVSAEQPTSLLTSIGQILRQLPDGVIRSVLQIDVTRHRSEKKPGEDQATTVLVIPEAGVSGVRGSLDVELTPQQAAELAQIVTELAQLADDPDRYDAMKDSVRGELSWLRQLAIGACGAVGLTSWRTALVRHGLQKRIKQLIPNSQLILYAPQPDPSAQAIS